MKFKMNKIRNIILISSFGLILLCPFLLELIESRLDLDLSGVTYDVNAPQITVDGLLDGATQSSVDDYLNQHLPGRDFMIRVRNEALFSFFPKSPNENIIYGRDRTLFEAEYVYKYEKIYPPASEEFVRELKDKLIYIRDHL